MGRLTEEGFLIDWAVKPAPTEEIYALCMLCKEFERLHGTEIYAMVYSMPDYPGHSNIDAIIDPIAKKMFSDGVNMGRVISFLYIL